MKKWEKISSKYALNNPHMMIRQDTVKLPTDKILDDYFVYEEPDVALIVPVTKEGKFVFVRQYKHALADIAIEFPAGYIEKEELPLDAALRELKEETGFVAGSVSPLFEFVNSPSKVQSNVYSFLALNCIRTEDSKQNLDMNEEIEVLTKTFKEVREMINKGEIKISGTIAAFYLASEKLGLKV